jgi:hypothetical protein
MGTPAMRNAVYFGVVTASLIFASSTGHAQITILGDYPPADDGTGNNIGLGQVFRKAQSFTMPAQGYDVTSIKLRLEIYQTGDADNVGIYTDNAGQPGTLVGSFLNAPPRVPMPLVILCSPRTARSLYRPTPPIG